MDVLVLNRSYMPLQRVSWQRAFGYLWTGKAEVVETYANRQVRSTTRTWPMPSIVRLVNTVASLFSRGVKFNRRNVYLRDKGRCQYCGCKVTTAEFTLDHVVPRSRGGKTTWANLVTACMRCNQRKGSRSVREAGFRLCTEPIKPRWVPGPAGTFAWRVGMPESWRDYLGSIRYWSEDLE
jgi:5-methylcytosine-specific restriction endonuclease McrA